MKHPQGTLLATYDGSRPPPSDESHDDKREQFSPTAPESMKHLELRSMPMGMSDLGPIELVQPESDCFLISCSADAANDAIALWGSGRHSDRMFITRQRESELVAVVETAARNWMHVPDIQPLPDGRTLLVAPRMLSRKDESAVIIDQHGDTVRAGTLGDGIKHMLTTSSGDVWVGYNDEGVLTGLHDFGSSGIMRFDRDLQPVWGYNGERGAADPVVYDCYSLNVTDDSTFACTYQKFPIIEIAEGIARLRSSGAKGVSSVLVRGDRAALFGGYGDQQDRVQIGTLESERVVTLVDDVWQQSRFPRSLMKRSVVTRGAQLNVFEAQFWSRYQLD